MDSRHAIVTVRVQRPWTAGIGCDRLNEEGLVRSARRPARSWRWRCTQRPSRTFMPIRARWGHRASPAYGLLESVWLRNCVYKNLCLAITHPQLRDCATIYSASPTS